MGDGENSKNQTKRTKLGQHDKVGSQLKPPFAKLENIHFSSWKDLRMPEMLWAVLAIGNWERDTALAFFRHVATFAQNNNQCSDVTHTGIGELKKEDRLNLIRHVAEFPKASDLLKSLLLFPDLPAYEDWKTILSDPNPDEDWDKVARGVIKTLDHQSQEATDCRWVKLLCEILGGKIKFPQSMEDKLKALFNYPNEGDLREIRPFIRAGEIGQTFKERSEDWPKAFWETSRLSTICIPLPPQERTESIEKILSSEEIERVRMLLLEHFIKTCNTTALDPKHHTVFGLSFYALRLLEEITATNLFRGATSRLSLRTLVEIYITLKYLTQEENQNFWYKFCEYGDSQAKLVSLKIAELGRSPDFINDEEVRQIANENKWEEFITIELGHWDKTDLRKLSIDADCKEIYDTYYPWSSCYTHGNLAAVKESSLGHCANPVHRLHKIPNVRILPLSSSLNDMIDIANKILGLVSENYPDFDSRIEMQDGPIHEN